MIHIVFVVPYEDMLHMVNEVFDCYDKKQDLTKQIVLETADTVDLPKSMKCDVIIARGYTAKKLKETFRSVPIIEIPFTGYDVIRALVDARKQYHPNKVAAIGFQSVFQNAVEFTELFGFDLLVYNHLSIKSVEKTLRQALEDGCDAVIGGYTVAKSARNFDVNAVAIRTGREAIHNALDEAVRIVQMLRLERERMEEQHIMIESVKDGILYVDHEKNILSHNTAARKILKKSGFDKRSLTDFFSFMAPYVEKCIETREEQMDQLHQLGSVTISASYMPVNIENEVIGVVIIFQDITYIQQLENQIRCQLSKKGL